jgi:hypothetical protein
MKQVGTGVTEAFTADHIYEPHARIAILRRIRDLYDRFIVGFFVGHHHALIIAVPCLGFNYQKNNLFHPKNDTTLAYIRADCKYCMHEIRVRYYKRDTFYSFVSGNCLTSYKKKSSN